MTQYQFLCKKTPEELEALGVGWNLAEMMAVNLVRAKEAAGIDALCPARLSEALLGYEAACEVVEPTPGRCRACRARFLDSEHVEMPQRAFMD